MIVNTSIRLERNGDGGSDGGDCGDGGDGDSGDDGDICKSSTAVV